MNSTKHIKINELSHRQAALASTYDHISLKAFVERAIAFYIQSHEKLSQFVDHGLEANQEAGEYSISKDEWIR